MSTKILILKTIFSEILKAPILRRIEDEVSDTGHHSQYLFNRVQSDFPSLARKSATAGVLLQNVIKYIVNTKPAPEKIKELFQPITRIFISLYPLIQTRQKIFSSFREILKRKYGIQSEIYKYSKGHLSISFQEFRDVMKHQESRRDEANRNKLLFDRQKIFDVMTKLKGSPKWENQVILAQLSSGARLIEILRQSEFEALPGAPNLIKVRGVVKKKTGAEQFTFEKPLIFLRADEFIHIITDLRKLTLDDDGEEISNQKMTARYNGRINKQIKELGLGTTSHNLRKIYGELSFDLFADQNSISKNEWLKSVLGHSHTETSLHYTNIRLRSSNVECPTQIDQLKSVVNALELKIDTLHSNNNAEKPDNDEIIKIRLKDGRVVEFAKWVHLRRAWDVQKARLAEIARKFAQYGIPVSTHSFRKIGVGSTLSSQYIREL